MTKTQHKLTIWEQAMIAMLTIVSIAITVLLLFRSSEIGYPHQQLGILSSFVGLLMFTVYLTYWIREKIHGENKN